MELQIAGLRPSNTAGIWGVELFGRITDQEFNEMMSKQKNGTVNMVMENE